jgi:hypothetical protein
MAETKQPQKGKSPRSSLRDQLLARLRSGAEGVKLWNARKFADRLKAGSFAQADLSGADLSKIDLSSPFEKGDKGLDFQQAVFDNATLIEANLDQSNFGQASFKGADCRQARLRGAQCPFAHFEGASLLQARLRGTVFSNANFTRADLTGADLSYANLCDADLTGATLANVKFDHTRYNKDTQFPSGFVIGEGLELIEAVAIQPLTTGRKKSSGPPTPVNRDQFLRQLEKKVDPGRLGRALDMLRADRFHLFSQLDENSLVGVVKSQREPDLVYSCSLDSAGNFSCCNQSLEVCMGLRGALCKHIMVLLVGLVRASHLDHNTALDWVEASLTKRNYLDPDRASTVFLRYKGAEAGEIDWRPTETIPEDFYAF